jgi:hypothetical protein
MTGLVHVAALVGQPAGDVAVGVPAAYLDLMSRSNGVEGFVGDQYLVLWPVEQLQELNDAYATAEFAPGLLLIGSDGGGTGL